MVLEVFDKIYCLCKFRILLLFENILGKCDLKSETKITLTTVLYYIISNKKVIKSILNI